MNEDKALDFAALRTPFIVVDAGRVRENLSRMAAYADQHKLLLRPCAVHGSTQLAKMQIEHGAIGLSAGSVGQAEAMAAVADDLLVRLPAPDVEQARRLAHLAMHNTVRVAIDSRAAADALAAAARARACTLGVLVEVNVAPQLAGPHQPDAALALATHIDRAAGLRFDGLCCSIRHIRLPAQLQQPALEQVSDRLDAVLSLWDEHSLEPNIVSGGSTRTAYQSHWIPEYTELRAGRYIFNDLSLFQAGFCTRDDLAASVIATVIHSEPGRVIIDADARMLSHPPGPTAPDSSCGQIVEFPKAKIVKTTDEAAIVELPAEARRPRAGARVTVLPNDITVCLANEQQYYLREADGTLQALSIVR